jgi:hypothetical protein
MVSCIHKFRKLEKYHTLLTAPTSPVGAILLYLKRATVTLPDDLAEAVESYRQSQEAPPSLTTVVQTALRDYLRQRGFLTSRRPLRITPVGRSGRSDISREHDAYLAGTKK